MGYLPWDQINDFLLRAGAAGSRDAFLEFVLAELGTVIPWDVGVGVFTRDIRCAAGKGWSARAYREYNSRYCEMVPFILYDDRGAALGGKDVVRWDAVPDCEFTADFSKPLRLAYGLSPFRPRLARNLSVQRSRDYPEFTPRDCRVLDVINAHMNNFMVLYDRIGGRDESRWEESLSRCFCLTERELTVVERLRAGLSNRAIAADLFVSERTVKAHLASIFQKTGTASRVQVLALVARL